MQSIATLQFLSCNDIATQLWDVTNFKHHDYSLCHTNQISKFYGKGSNSNESSLTEHTIFGKKEKEKTLLVYVLAVYTLDWVQLTKIMQVDGST